MECNKYKYSTIEQSGMAWKKTVGWNRIEWSEIEQKKEWHALVITGYQCCLGFEPPGQQEV